MSCPTCRRSRTAGNDDHERAGFIAIRVLVFIWLAALTVILLVSGHWGWTILTGAGAVANAVFSWRNRSLRPATRCR